MATRRSLTDRLLERTRHEYSPRQRTVAMLCLAPIFLVVLPLLLIRLGAVLDQWLGLPPIVSPPVHLILGVLLTVSGWMFAMWSGYRLFTIGRGTPVPLMATQELITQPPYTYCRNPMVLGTIVMYLGVAILARSVGAVLLVLLFTGLLLIYVKRGEEREMETRFGPEYLAYRERTPFLVPRFRNRR